MELPGSSADDAEDHVGEVSDSVSPVSLFNVDRMMRQADRRRMFQPHVIDPQMRRWAQRAG